MPFWPFSNSDAGSDPATGGKAGLFDEAVHCCICFEEKPGKMFTLPCAKSHLMCTDCLIEYQHNQCPQPCKPVKFDRAQVFDLFGLQMPPPPAEVPRRRQVGREYVAADDFLPQRVTSCLSQSPSMTFVMACTKTGCSSHGCDKLIHLSQGRHNLLAMPQHTVCQMCLHEMSPQRVLIRNCNAKFEIREAFSNGRMKSTEKVVESLGRQTELNMPGHYMQFEVTISKHTILPRLAEASPPGALILSVEKGRPRAVAEQQSAKAFLEKCGYTVKLVRDPTLVQLQTELKAFASQQKGQSTCAVAIMAHGSDGFIQTSDEYSAALAQVFGILDGKNAPWLQDTKKYFFIQACRGQGEAVVQDWKDGEDDPLQFTRAKNFQWCYATTPGLPAYRGLMFGELKTAADELMPNGGMDRVIRRANTALDANHNVMMIVNHTIMD